MHKLLATFALFTLIACGGSKPAAQEPPDKTGDTTEPADENAMGGENVDRLCTMYVDGKHEGEWDGEGEKPAPDAAEVAACKESLGKRSAAEREQISTCVNSCGAADGVVTCIDDFGTPEFDITCGNDAGGDDDDGGDDSGD